MFVKIKDFDVINAQMKHTTINEYGEFTVFADDRLQYIKAGIGFFDHNRGYFINMRSSSRDLLFDLANIAHEEIETFIKLTIGYFIKTSGGTICMKTIKDVLKVLLELDKRYSFEKPKTIKKMESTIMIENVDEINAKMKYTSITKAGAVTVKLDSQILTGQIRHFSKDKNYLFMHGIKNYILFNLAHVDSPELFTKSILGYHILGPAEWPWMKSVEDVITVLMELDRRYKPETLEAMTKSDSSKLVHASIESIDFTRKKKHYKLNFSV